MATRQTAAIAILTDYTQAEEDTYAAELLAAGAVAGNYIYNTTIGHIRIWDGSIFVNTTPIPPLLVPLATSTAQGGVPALGAALKIIRVNAAGTALEYVTLAGGGDMLAANNLSDVANVNIARDNLGLSAVEPYKELVYTGDDLTRINVWTDVTMTTKLYQTDLTYDGNGVLILKQVERISDTFVYTVDFIYDGNGTLINTETTII